MRAHLGRRAGAAVLTGALARLGHPASSIRDYRHWAVLVRPEQPTLGAVVIAALTEATAFGALPAAAFAELARVIADAEAALRAAVRYEKINYLALMMIEPHVHFHAIPRYHGVREALGIGVPDAGWPGPPRLDSHVTLDDRGIAAMAAWLRGQWPSTEAV